MPEGRVLRKNFIKSCLKYTDRGAFSLINFDWGVEETLAIWRPSSSKFWVFWNFWKKEKWMTLNQKISVMKVWNSKIWDDSFLHFPLASSECTPLFSRRCFHGYICRSKSPNLQISKKDKNGRFRIAKPAP